MADPFDLDAPAVPQQPPPGVEPPAATAAPQQPQPQADKFDLDAPVTHQPPSGGKQSGDDMSWGETGWDVAKSAGIGVPKGIIEGVGLPGTIRHMASKGVEYAGEFLGGTPEQIQKAKDRIKVAAQFNPVSAPMMRAIAQSPTPEQIQRKVEGVTGEFYEPKTRLGKIAEKTTEFAANPLNYIAPGSKVVQGLTGAAMGAGSEVAGQGAEALGGEGVPADVARVIGAVVAGKMPYAVASAKFKSALRNATSTEQLFDTSDHLYDLTRAAPFQVRGKAVLIKKDGIVDALKLDGKNEFTAPTTSRILNESLPEMATRLGDYGITQLQTLRKTLGEVAKPGSGHVPTDRNAARFAIGEINKFLANEVKVSDMVGDVSKFPQALKDWKSADRAYSVGMRAEQLENAREKAMSMTAGSGKGGNFENNMRKQLLRIAESKVLSSGFTQEEVAIMRSAGRGEGNNNLLRAVGALAPTGIVSGGIGLEIGHILFGGWKSALPLGVGYLAKKASDRMIANKFDDLIARVRLRGHDGPVPKEPGALSPGRYAPLLPDTEDQTIERAQRASGGRARLG